MAPFSFSTEKIIRKQAPCYITYTNKNTHKIILDNLDRSPLYTGVIKATGVRYCPSIEDKVVKFSDKIRHQIFLEPEGKNTTEIYVNGFSTSLPEEVQLLGIRTIPGLENAIVTRFGYAVEYDFFPPTQIYANMETKYVETKVKRAIDVYNEAIVKNQDTPKFDIQDLRDVFIKHILNHKDDVGLRTLLTAFITFVVEWDFRNEHFDLGVQKGTAEPVFMHLFRGCVLFESLLKRNPSPKPKHDDQKRELGKLINYYKSEMNLQLLGDFTKKTKIKSLDELLSEMKKRNKDIEDSILVSYWLRNVLGHSLAWNVSIEQDSYRELYL